MRKFLLLLGMALIVMAAVVPAAMAQSADAQGSAAFKGTGVLHAVGSGLARFEGSGAVRGTLVAGTLTVRGAEQVYVQGFGRKEVLPDGTERYIGVRGNFAVSGRNLTFAIEGTGINVTAAGRGAAWLRGTGHYWVDGRYIGPWPGDPRPVTVGQP